MPSGLLEVERRLALPKETKKCDSRSDCAGDASCDFETDAGTGMCLRLTSS